MSSVEIRSALPSDAFSFRELRLKALKDHPDEFGMTHEEAAAKEQNYWVNALQYEKSEKEIFFAVSQDNNLIGMAGIYRNPSLKARHSASIWGVYVSPQWRGNRIGESLVNNCLGWARAQKIEIARLAVVTTNLPALRSYLKCGFKIYGTEAKAISHNGLYYDEHMMDIEIFSNTSSS